MNSTDPLCDGSREIVTCLRLHVCVCANIRVGGVRGQHFEASSHFPPYESQRLNSGLQLVFRSELSSSYYLLTLMASSLPTEVTSQPPRFLFYVFCLVLSWLNYNSYPNKWGRYLWQICRAQKVCNPSGVMAGAEPGYLCPGCLCSSWRCPFATRPFNIHLKLKDQNLCFHPIKHIAVVPFYQT